MKIEVERVLEFEGRDILWYFCKGHVNKALFIDAINAKLIAFDPAVWEYNPDDVEYIFCRNIPIAGMPGQTTLYRSEPGRGAYKATVIDVQNVDLRRTVERWPEEMKALIIK